MRSETITHIKNDIAKADKKKSVQSWLANVFGLLIWIGVLAAIVFLPIRQHSKDNPKPDPKADVAPDCDYCDP